MSRDDTRIRVPARLWRFRQHAPRVTAFTLAPEHRGSRMIYRGWGWQRIVGPMMLFTVLAVFPFGIWRYGGFSFSGDRVIFVIMSSAAMLVLLRTLWHLCSFPVLILDRHTASFELRDGFLARRLVDEGSAADLRVGVFRWHVFYRTGKGRSFRTEKDFAVIAFSERGTIVLRAACDKNDASRHIERQFDDLVRQDELSEPVRAPGFWL